MVGLLRLFLGLRAAALALVPPLAGAVMSQPRFVTEVSTNAELAALSLAAGSTVYRAGFYASGDGGAATYTYSASACPLNSGVGDNGSQVASSGGGCWIADFNAIPASVRQWGAYGDCTHDDSAAITASLEAAVRVVDRVSTPGAPVRTAARFTVADREPGLREA